MLRSPLLAAYDDQLRTTAELASATGVCTLGPLLLAVFDGRRGFITYRSLSGFDGLQDDAELTRLIREALAHFERQPDIVEVEWKTRGHDLPIDMPQRLVSAGFTPEPAEAVMIGEASKLARDVAIPIGFAVKRADTEVDLRAALTCAARVFGDSPDDLQGRIASALRRLADPEDASEVWLVDHEGTVVCSGRIEPVESTEFAGIWGGACLSEYRGRGLYRALTAARARVALRHGKRYLHSDSTPYSQPILERSGLVHVTTTTPYVWRRG